MTSPIPFKPRKSSKIDEGIFKLIEEFDVHIPIIFIKENLYLIGTARVICEMRADIVIVRYGGITDTLSNYLYHNHKLFEKFLALRVLESK